MSELTLRGHPASAGAALGRAWRHAGAPPAGVGSAEDECEAVARGLRLAAHELSELAAALRAGGHAADAEIVDTNRLMAEDAALFDAALAAAREGLGAPEAIGRAAEPHVEALAGLDDPNLAARAADLRSIARRAGELARGGGSSPPEGAIVLAEDLGPGDVAAWAGIVAGIVLSEGGSTAHAAIVARSLAVPLVTGAGSRLLQIADGEEIAVDGDRGLVLRSVDADTRDRLLRRIGLAAEEAERAKRERLEPSVTCDGRAVRLLANAGSAAEVRAALEAGAEGVGLLRSELAFLDASDWPSEDQHAEALAPMLSLLQNRLATVRTLDFGGDKTPPFLLASGADSMLGPRGIRAALAAEGGVTPQLRGLMRVSGESLLRILIPMVTEAAEVDAVRELALLARDAVSPGAPDPLVGGMIEVPAAALNAQAIARHCDFLSIGTNDLVQYTLAADRQNPHVAERAVAYHPAVVRLISRVVAAGRSAGIPVDVCGEAAGDAELLPLLIGLGVDEISVSPARIGRTRRMIRSLSLERCRAAAAEALRGTTAAEVAAVATRAFGEQGSGQRREQAGDHVERL
ncbi:MAG: phosphoenolpyruvate--protein phosphotransferase [Gaiellales bacterium]|jgi:multiphosphoryl transfer protein